MSNLGPVHVNPKTGVAIAWQGRQFESLAAAQKFAGMLELTAGRELAWQEIDAEYGIYQRAYDALGESIKRRDREWAPPVIVTNSNVSENPFDRPDIRQLARPKQHRSAREEIYAQGRAEWEAAQDQATLDRVDAETRAPVVKATRDLADQLRVSADSTLDEVRDALKMARAAETPYVDLDWVKSEYVRLSDAQTSRRKAQHAAIQEQIDRLNLLMGEPAPAPQPQKSGGIGYWFTVSEFDPRREEKLRENAMYEAIHGGPPSADSVAKALGQ